ncbi:hypothetical protein GTA62_04510 [Roseobacter sp. HKCCD9010]|uniref:trimethylamine methyltransferase family protein n=1 Tax=unclassified Roseobacter TaxID=196798 RepID=UPI001490DB69|nr:hypothetical protein [Rhodobacterales bacterium HKCCD4356]NNV10866.1 hypothetical protein [Roseobacter sp. HKCCD7357]NNV15051.1 hypothetical protein [Roseobacter sp. HKCCD8768]NNV24510.1 hypothetical protein [Roseobacter sp. HKCCD8192]NNV28767.1 hypothetical protein [Roseobacter sp. HKCCD9061]NNV33040.1 hypothetical protein [Roseobacter sp. HKCCD9073]NNV37291.1 hypothetical protein [Roseobacter sp. HKCCD9054]NNV41248.1 hypothetical protein [Roseobacter sp. HKCCD6497]NNV50061.1 hypothetic
MRHTSRVCRRDARSGHSQLTLKHRLPPIARMGPEQVVRINAASMHVLGNVGAQFRDDIAQQDWGKTRAKARCSVPGFLRCPRCLASALRPSTPAAKPTRQRPTRAINTISKAPLN